jgi:hypothetical protein
MAYIPSDLRQFARERAGYCCEYCRLPESAGTVTFHIEHVIAVSHGGLTDEDNLAYSCSICNHYKGPNIAAADRETGDPTFLYHPRRHRWDDHFNLNDAVIEPRTPEGRATVFLLRFNDPPRVAQRKVLIQLGKYPCNKE